MKALRILVAEDEKPLAHALQLKLTSAGYEVEIAGDGNQALEMLTAKSFDLVLLDLMMPRRDGFSVLEEMQKKGIKVRTIVSSNLGQQEDIERAKGLGAIDFFTKSNTPLTEIIAKVKTYLT